MTPTRIEVEQAIARGMTLDWICDTLGASPQFVDAVLDRMDRLTGYRVELDEAEPGQWIAGRPLASYYGPAAPDVIEELVDALCPRQPRANHRWVA